MDVKQYMIVDLEKKGDKRMFITEQVTSINMNTKGLWEVQFGNSPRSFHYNTSRLLCLTKPKSINLEERGIYIDNEHITNVKELLCFTDERHKFYHITYSNGYYENLEMQHVYITRTPIDKNGGSNWDYLKKLAAETGLTTEKDESILSKQYDLVDITRDNVPLAQYLGNKTKLNIYQKEEIYYPFGCNASQKTAVEQALTHQVSIIQGPPGTGKTQTILNIISNLLIDNKTVLVVSNNNSAVENVKEKLASEGLDFIVAKLGSVQNKEAFIANQSDYPPMNDWILQEPTNIKQLAIDALQTISQGFNTQTQEAQLKTKYDALLKEKKYNDMLGSETEDTEWLNNKDLSKLLKLLDMYQRITEKTQKPNIWFRLKWAFSLGFKMFTFLHTNPANVISKLESAFYTAKKAEIEEELKSIQSTLQNIDINQNLKDLRIYSLQLLKHSIAKRYDQRERKKFAITEIKTKTKDFLREYPVVLSTTYSAKSCISNKMVFDYVIMDEASQVDIKTGALALSCAINAVIVGDDKQLPNVINHEEELALKAIQSTYNIDDRYNAVSHSFLQSCIEVFKDAPSTLLREHYRCHPKIIEFCNKRFYNNELVTMTTDSKEEKVLQVVRTVKGNHARGHFNQREIDVITKEILPEYASMGSIGIITPYRLQATEINKTLGQDIASTVHKFQGRECDTIIMSMVDNSITEFSDDPNLLNVAISRAKKHLCIVTNGNDMEQDTNLAQLISYIQYNNFEIKESKLHSVFDLLYKQYTIERLTYESKHSAISEHLSENLIYNILVKSLNESEITNMEVLCHYPLSRLVADWNLLDEKEKVFAENPFSHVDFLIYNSITKQPLMAFEIDGWHFHKESEVQEYRDNLKNQILSKLQLNLKRISTTDIVNEDSVRKWLQAI